jgi:hypothetical protein
VAEDDGGTITTKSYGHFLLANGSSYVGEYNIIQAPAAEGAPAEVVGTAAEPLLDGAGQPLVPSMEKDEDGVLRRKGGDVESQKKEIHGYGKLLFGPELYDGEWRHGQMVKGKHVFASGAVYEGFFLHNKFHGFGRYCWADGREYEGYFCGGKMHGEGAYRNFTGGNPSHFAGFSVEGKFTSGHAQQASAKAAYVEGYGKDFLESAKAALAGDKNSMLVAPGLADEWANGRPFAEICDGPGAGVDAAEGEAEELEALVSAAREAHKELGTLLLGPCPTSADLPLLEELAAAVGLAEEGETTMTVLADPPAEVTVPMLRYLGQCVELSGASGSVTLCNVGYSKGAMADDAETVWDLDVSKADWRFIKATSKEE